MRICPQCKGTGERHMTFWEMFWAYLVDDDTDCDFCLGHGAVERPERPPAPPKTGEPAKQQKKSDSVFIDNHASFTSGYL